MTTWREKQAARPDPVMAAIDAYHHDHHRPEYERMRDAIDAAVRAK